MGDQIIKQPNGLYAVYSSIVDDFVMTNALPCHIVEAMVNDARERIEARVLAELERLERGERRRTTKSFDEAIEWIREVHGKRRANKAVKECSCVRSGG